MHSNEVIELAYFGGLTSLKLLNFSVIRSARSRLAPDWHSRS